MTWLSTKDTDGNFLPEKKEDSLQDCLDSIPRGGEVSNEVLYYKAMRDLVELATFMTNRLMHKRSIVVLLVRYQLNRLLNEEGG